jgi:hypothetical protein
MRLKAIAKRLSHKKILDSLKSECLLLGGAQLCKKQHFLIYFCVLFPAILVSIVFCLDSS